MKHKHPTCQSCKHWGDFKKDPNENTCTLIDMESSIKRNGQLLVQLSTDWGALITGKDFYCALHQPQDDFEICTK